eukprot:575650-Pleurochrysis_carterae.AAC.1
MRGGGGGGDGGDGGCCDGTAGGDDIDGDDGDDDGSAVGGRVNLEAKTDPGRSVGVCGSHPRFESSFRVARNRISGCTRLRLSASRSASSFQMPHTFSHAV